MAWKECGGEKQRERGNAYGLFHCTKEKLHWVLYCPFIDFALRPSISFLLVAASVWLLKKEKCQNLQITKVLGKGCWSFPYPSQGKKKNPFFVLFMLIDFFFAFLIYPIWYFPVTRFSIRHMCEAARGRKKQITSKQLYQSLCKKKTNHHHHHPMVFVRGKES